MQGLIYSVYYCLYVCIVYVIYPAWDAVFLWGISSGDETLCQMLDITSQIKWFYKAKLRMQMSSFSSDFSTLIKH